MKRRLLLLPLFGLFFGAACLFFFWLSLPWDRVEEMVARKLEVATGYQVTMEELGSYWFTGIEATNVVLTKPLTPAQRKALAEARKKEGQAGRAGGGTGAGGGAASASDGIGQGRDETSGSGDAARAKAPPRSASVPAKEVPAEDDGQEAAAEEEGKENAAKEKGASPALPVLPPPIRIPRLTARLAVLPLLIGRVTVDVSAEIAGGSLDARVGKRGESYSVELKLDDILLAGIPGLAERLPLPLKGTIGAEGVLVWEPREMSRTKGRLKLALKKAELGTGSIPLPKGSLFPTFELATPTKLGTLQLELVVGEEQAREPTAALASIKSFEHEGEDVELKVEGDIVLTARPAESRPDLTVGVRFADPFVERNHLKMLLASRDVKRYVKEDFIGATVRGTIGHPDLRPAAPVWGKSRAYLRASPAAASRAGKAAPEQRGKVRPPAAGTRPGAIPGKPLSAGGARRQLGTPGHPARPSSAAEEIDEPEE